VDKNRIVIDAQIPSLVEIFEDKFSRVVTPPLPNPSWGKPLIGALK